MAQENEGEFRVGSRVIQIARAIWQDSCMDVQPASCAVLARVIV